MLRRGPRRPGPQPRGRTGARVARRRAAHPGARGQLVDTAPATAPPWRANAVERRPGAADRRPPEPGHDVAAIRPQPLAASPRPAIREVWRRHRATPGA